MSEKNDEKEFPVKIDLTSKGLIAAYAEFIDFAGEIIYKELAEKGFEVNEITERLIKTLKGHLKRQVELDGYIGSKDYQIILRKIKDLELKQKIQVIKDDNESLEDTLNFNAKQKVYMLDQLGVLKHLQNNEKPHSNAIKRNNSTNSIAEILSPLVEEKSGTLQPYINSYLNSKIPKVPNKKDKGAVDFFLTKKGFK